MGRLIVLQGLPASGKSTLAKKLYDEDPEHSIIVNRDSLRRARGNYWVPSQEDFISKLESYMVRQGLKAGYKVILDATNLNPMFLDKWTKIAAEFHVVPRYIKLNTPLEECLKRNHNPDRKDVPDEVILNFYRKYKDILDI